MLNSMLLFNGLQKGVLTNKDFSSLCLVSFLNKKFLCNLSLSRDDDSRRIELIGLFDVDCFTFSVWLSSKTTQHKATPTLTVFSLTTTTTRWRINPSEPCGRDMKNRAKRENPCWEQNEMNYVYDGGNSLWSHSLFLMIFCVCFICFLGSLPKKSFENIWWEYRGIIACPYNRVLSIISRRPC